MRMKMIDNVELFNHLYFSENPLTIFIDPNSIYHDYHLRVKETCTFYDSMIRVSENRMHKWNMQNDHALGNLLIAYYAGYFELFSKDGIVDLFYSNFPSYCEEVLLGNDGYVFKDILGDTFIHYASYSFDCLDHLVELYSILKAKNPKILNPLHMKNLNGLTPSSILLE